MVKKLKDRTRPCSICDAETLHDLCRNCRRSVDTAIRNFQASQEPRVYGPTHPSWSQTSTGQT